MIMIKNKNNNNDNHNNYKHKIKKILTNYKACISIVKSVKNIQVIPFQKN